MIFCSNYTQITCDAARLAGYPSTLPPLSSGPILVNNQHEYYDCYDWHCIQPGIQNSIAGFSAIYLHRNYLMDFHIQYTHGRLKTI